MQRYIKLLVVTSTMRTFFYSFNVNVIVATDNKQNNDSNGMARTNTALLLKGVNNKFNKLHKSTQQDNERKRSANGTNLTTSTYRISVLNSFHLVNAGVH